jgi:MFS family permease
MLTTDAMPNALRTLTRDGWLLFLTRFVRLFAYGSLSVVLVFYLIGLGLSESQTGLLLTLTLAGDTFVSLYLTTRADRIGRRRMLIIGAILMAAAGLAFAFTHNFLLLIVEMFGRPHSGPTLFVLPAPCIARPYKAQRSILLSSTFHDS